MVFEQYVRFSSAVFGIFGQGLLGQYIIICLPSAAVIVPPGLVPQSAITGEKCPHLSSSSPPSTPLPTLIPHLPPANSLLFWIVSKLLAFLCPPYVGGIKGTGCHIDICPTDMVRMHLCDMDINSLHVHSSYSIWLFTQRPSRSVKSPDSVSNCYSCTMNKPMVFIM